MWPGTCHFPCLCYRPLICKWNDNSLNPVSFLWGWHRVMYMKGLEEGLAFFQAKVSQISVITKVRADFMHLCWRKGNIERKILEISLNDFEMWEIWSISFAIFPFQQHNFFVDHHFFSWTEIRFWFWWCYKRTGGLIRQEWGGGLYPWPRFLHMEQPPVLSFYQAHGSHVVSLLLMLLVSNQGPLRLLPNTYRTALPTRCQK